MNIPGNKDQAKSISDALTKIYSAIDEQLSEQGGLLDNSRYVPDEYRYDARKTKKEITTRDIKEAEKIAKYFGTSVKDIDTDNRVVYLSGGMGIGKTIVVKDLQRLNIKSFEEGAQFSHNTWLKVTLNK